MNTKNYARTRKDALEHRTAAGSWITHLTVRWISQPFGLGRIYPGFALWITLEGLAVDYGPVGPVDYGLRPVDYASRARCGLRTLTHAVD